MVGIQGIRFQGYITLHLRSYIPILPREHRPYTLRRQSVNRGSGRQDDQPASTAPPRAVYGRDLITGLYTASSFAHSQNDFFE